jgi:DHA1 family multidrug resistance protein-like MFS transporter
MAPPPPASILTEAQRRRGILALMILNFFAWGGFFLVIPLVAVHYVDNLGWAAGTVGLLLAIRQFSQQSLTTLFGVVCDRIGPKPLICIGMLIRAAGFAAMAFAETFPLVLASLLLAGLGGAMFESPKNAATAYLSKPEERQRLYAMIGVIGGLGVTIGTQLGAFLIRSDFATVCLVSGVAYLIIFLVMLTLMPPIKVSVSAETSLGGLALALRDRTFVRFLLLLTGYWFAWTQFSLTITLAATDITGTNAAVSWIYAVNTAITVGLGYFLPRWLERWFAPVDLLIWGTFVLSIGLAVVGFATDTRSVLFAAAIFSIGAVIARPGQETVTANLADPAARGTYFGVASLSLAIGGGLGNFLGGLAYDLGLGSGMPALPWILFGGIGLVTGLGLLLNKHRFSAVRDLTPADRVKAPSAPPPLAAQPDPGR